MLKPLLTLSLALCSFFCLLTMRCKLYLLSLGFVASPLSLARASGPITLLSSRSSASFCPASTSNCKHARRDLPTMSVSAVPRASRDITGPTWTLDYASLDAAALHADLTAAKADMESMEATGATLAELVPLARDLTEAQIAEHNVLARLVDMFRKYWNAVVLLRNVSTYAHCVASVDGTDADAKRLSGQLEVLFARCRTSYEPAALILDLCPASLFDAFLATDDSTRAAKFKLSHSRKMARHRLSLEEENMVTMLTVTGHSAWGSLYTDLSSVLPVHMKQPDGSVKTMGIASAEAMRDSSEEEVRRSSWEAIREAWLPHQETCAAVLNAITGWRLDMYGKRRHDSFLTSSLYLNRMSKATLDAIFKALDSSSEVGRRALRIQAKALKKKALEPWDLFAPAPVSSADVGKIYTFDEGINLIANAVGAVDAEGGSFVRMMQEKGWIEASRGDKKRPGA